jgi:hypothetical protein
MYTYVHLGDEVGDDAEGRVAFALDLLPNELDLRCRELFLVAGACIQHASAYGSKHQHTSACGRMRRERCIVAGAWHELELMRTRIYRGLDRYMRRICSMLYLLYLPDTNSNV